LDSRINQKIFSFPLPFAALGAKFVEAFGETAFPEEGFALGTQLTKNPVAVKV
jgi:hypothetical protein